MTNWKIHKRQYLYACEIVMRVGREMRQTDWRGGDVCGYHRNHSCFISKGLLIPKNSPGFDVLVPVCLVLLFFCLCLCLPLFH